MRFLNNLSGSIHALTSNRPTCLIPENVRCFWPTIRPKDRRCQLFAFQVYDFGTYEITQEKLNVKNTRINEWN